MPHHQAKSKSPHQQVNMNAHIQNNAIAGLKGSGVTIPHLKTIQASFGANPRYDLSYAKAHTGNAAQLACKNIGAQGYAVGERMALNRTDLGMVAHEAAHIIQQRAGVQLKDGVGKLGDFYERHADAVAARVVSGRSAEALLAALPVKTPIANRAVQMGKFYGGGHFKPAKSLPTKENDPDFGPVNPKTGCAQWAQVYVTGLSLTSAPADPIGFDKWKNYGVLKDPTVDWQNQALTRMHAVRGRFLGPSIEKNMFLGTRLSNNFNDHSHYRQIEKPIEDFLKKEKEAIGVNYKVIPDFSGAPQYILDKADKDIGSSAEKNEFKAWAKEACPPSFFCQAEFYKNDPATDNNLVYSAAQRQFTTVGIAGAPSAPTSSSFQQSKVKAVSKPKTKPKGLSADAGKKSNPLKAKKKLTKQVGAFKLRRSSRKNKGKKSKADD